tara:strand:+ start:71 stop:292 length:222 start_codon:yes stop_codon:yes gene_type:complete
MSGQQEQINNNEGVNDGGVNENTRPQSPPRGQVNTWAKIEGNTSLTWAPSRLIRGPMNIVSNTANRRIEQDFH